MSNLSVPLLLLIGELIMRGGIFWRPLRFNLVDCGKIINAAMLLHNFLVDQREDDIAYFKTFSVDTVVRDSTQLAQERGLPEPSVTDTGALRPAGRPSTEETESKEIGAIFRDKLAQRLFVHDMKRPLKDNMTRNAYGHVYTT
jgi:hypothetical protein